MFSISLNGTNAHGRDTDIYVLNINSWSNQLNRLLGINNI